MEKRGLEGQLFETGLGVPYLTEEELKIFQPYIDAIYQLTGKEKIEALRKYERMVDNYLYRKHLHSIVSNNSLTGVAKEVGKVFKTSTIAEDLDAMTRLVRTMKR